MLEEDEGINNDDWKVFEKFISQLLDVADLFQIVVNKQNEIFYLRNLSQPLNSYFKIFISYEAHHFLNVLFISCTGLFKYEPT